MSLAHRPMGRCAGAAGPHAQVNARESRPVVWAAGLAGGTIPATNGPAVPPARDRQPACSACRSASYAGLGFRLLSIGVAAPWPLNTSGIHEWRSVKPQTV